MSDSEDKPDEQQQEGGKQHKIFLFVKAGCDGESIGCCPFSQRLSMMLWLKGAPFTITTYNKNSGTSKSQKELEDLAPGANPPFLVFNGELLTDIPKCEDYIEAELYPPHHPKLACKYTSSNMVGMDLFSRMQAYLKFDKEKNPEMFEKHRHRLLQELTKLNAYLMEPLDDEIDHNVEGDSQQPSSRFFLDGNTMTVADCNMLPKLNILRVAGQFRHGFMIPEEFTGIHRYLEAARQSVEFVETCPEDGEIVYAYGGRKPPLKPFRR